MTGPGFFQAQVKQMFFATCDLDRKFQKTRLMELCGDRPKLLREVSRLLDHDVDEALFDIETLQESDGWAGKTLNGYHLLERIGGGGTGLVYRAEDVSRKRPVAVKLLTARLLRDESLRRRVLLEARAAAKLHHPSKCPVYEIGEAYGQFYIVSAYVPGQTLDDAIRLRSISFPDGIEYAIQLTEVLMAAHAREIYHRDLKPGNVILTQETGGRKRAMVTDFGLAEMGLRNCDDPYICPEILRGSAISAQADIWPVGVMLHEMLTGRLPVESEEWGGRFPLPLEIGCTVRRYREMRELFDDLRAFRPAHSTVLLS